jgi:hypothetical protein
MGNGWFLNKLSAVLALVGGSVVLLRTQFLSTNRMRPPPFLVGGLLYAVFITVVIYCVVVPGFVFAH